MNKVEICYLDDGQHVKVELKDDVLAGIHDAVTAIVRRDNLAGYDINIDKLYFDVATPIASRRSVRVTAVGVDAAGRMYSRSLEIVEYAGDNIPKYEVFVPTWSVDWSFFAIPPEVDQSQPRTIENRFNTLFNMR